MRSRHKCDLSDCHPCFMCLSGSLPGWFVIFVFVMAYRIFVCWVRFLLLLEFLRNFNLVEGTFILLIVSEIPVNSFLAAFFFSSGSEVSWWGGAWWSKAALPHGSQGGERVRTRYNPQWNAPQ